MPFFKRIIFFCNCFLQRSGLVPPGSIVYSVWLLFESQVYFFQGQRLKGRFNFTLIDSRGIIIVT